MIFQVYCFHCEQKYEQGAPPKPGRCGACGSTRVGVLEEDRDNSVARSGYDRCTCGRLIFEGDRCIDCNKHVSEIPKCPTEGCNEICGGKHCSDHEED